jgi:queuine tRNA-ribosyltransferase accessory subunit
MPAARMGSDDVELSAKVPSILSGARVGELRAGPGQLPVPTPAPLLLTSRGQLPCLSRELFERTLPSPCPPLLFQVPLADWYCLNPNDAVLGAELIAAAGPPGGVAGFAALPDSAITVLSTRAAASADFLTKTPGNSLSISTDSGSHRPCITPLDVVTLHRALQTRYVEAPSDAPFLQSAPPWPPARSISRSLARADRLLKATFDTLDEKSNGNSPESPAAVLIPVQGGVDMVQRAVAASHAAEIFATRPKDFAGFVISGLYAGESPTERWNAVDSAVAALPNDPPRFLAGSLGSPSDVLEAVARGIDVIDTAYPFRIAADGCALDLDRGLKICLRDRKFERSPMPLLPGCRCLACGDGPRTGSFYSRAYIRHMLDVHEMLGDTLLAAHNLRNYLDWFQRLREAIAAGRFDQFRLEFYKVREDIRTGEEPSDLPQAASKLQAVGS